MEMALGILRTSISAFSSGYPSFTSIASLLVLPYSASLLLSQAFVSCTTTPMLETVADRLSPLLHAAATAGFPASVALLHRKASQAIFAFFFTLPFLLTFSLLAKSCVVLVVRDGARCPRRRRLPSFSSLLLLYGSVLQTHLLSSFLALSANSGILAFSLLVFSVVDALDLSTRLPFFLFLAVMHWTVVANVTVICNMAIVVAAMENRRGCFAFLKACLLVRGRTMTALCLVLPTNLGMAAAEALFQVRVVREYRLKGRVSPCLLWEAFSIAYLHALLMVFDVIMECMFYKKCCQRNLYLNYWGDESDDEEEEGEEEEEEELERGQEKKIYFEV